MCVCVCVCVCANMLVYFYMHTLYVFLYKVGNISQYTHTPRKHRYTAAYYTINVWMHDV